MELTKTLTACFACAESAGAFKLMRTIKNNFQTS